MSEGLGCGKCKRVHERIAQILPFRVIEATEGKPLRIAGVAMTAGMSRNHNVYTSEELQAFAPKLIGSPLYLEHVTVNNAIGKVTNCIFDAQTKSLLYEAEIYDPTIAEKVRNGLIQHVSVGADYDTLDSANVPQGLHNAEMSLVAVPGIPETNIQILESLRNVVETMEEKDIDSIAQKVAAKLGNKPLEIENLNKQLSEVKARLSEVEVARDQVKEQLSLANALLEKYKQLVPGLDLLADPPVLMAVSEVVERLEKVVPIQMVQRSWGLGPQRMCQELQQALNQFKEKAKRR